MCGRIVYGSYGFVAPDSCAGVSLTVAMALSCQIACAGVSLTVAMALSCQIACYVTWARCCNACVVRNSGSLRGLGAVLLRSVESLVNRCLGFDISLV